MRRSRIAQETAKLFDKLSPRKTRSSRAANIKPEPQEPDEKLQDENSLTPSRKRKRELTETTTLTTTRSSPRKKPIQSADAIPKKPRRQPAKQTRDEDGDLHVEPPPDWAKVYNLVADMRKTWLAPVDTMGCESLAEDNRSPRDRRFQTLVALMLSSQTKDTVTSVAMKNLQQGMPGGFCLESMLAIAPPELNEMINKVGFHNNKTKFIKAAAEICRDKHAGDIPDTIDGLVALPGVGPKMAYLTMSAAWGRDEGIGVDVHVHRITNLWGWHKTKSPEETRAALESWLPKDKWHDINHLLVGFGQTFCPPVGRKCDQCQLAQKGLCPSAVVAKVTKAKREIKIDEDVDDGAVKQEMVVKTEEVEIEAKQVDPAARSALPDIEDAVR